LHSFRKDLEKELKKAEDVDGAFVKATDNLKPFVVHHEGKQELYFTRKKEVGEK
jgi:hypothetical protein